MFGTILTTLVALMHIDVFWRAASVPFDSSGFPKVWIDADRMLSGHTRGGQDRLPLRRRLGTAHAPVASRRDSSCDAAFGTGDFLMQGRNLT